MGNTNSIKTIVVQAGQSLADIALQEYGNYEGIILVVQANPGLSVSSILEGGQELVIFTNAAINLVKETTKVEPYANQLQGVMQMWLSLTKIFIGLDGYRIWPGTLAEYNAITEKDAKTIYLVEEEEI